jgi:hypothetical protein
MRIPEAVQYRNKGTQSGAGKAVKYRNKGTQSGAGMIRYRTEIQDAGMPMPAASTSMPMPSYGKLARFMTNKILPLHVIFQFRT